MDESTASFGARFPRALLPGATGLLSARSNGKKETGDRDMMHDQNYIVGDVYKQPAAVSTGFSGNIFSSRFRPDAHRCVLAFLSSLLVVAVETITRKRYRDVDVEYAHNPRDLSEITQDLRDEIRALKRLASCLW